MTDKKLLELAAKAAGIEGEYESWCYNGFRDGIRKPKDNHRRPWNPLTEDDDALRLAVKLEILVDVCDKYTDATDGRYADICEMHHGDKYAATRRAIVRAAAEIGANK